VSIIALSLRLQLRNRSTAWLLLVIAILSAGIAALTQQVIAPHILVINQSVSLISATDILHGFPYILLNDMFNSYYATYAPIHPITISIAWLLGLFAVFGCLLGFLFGFRSAFTDKQTSVIPIATLRVSGASSRSMRTYLRRIAVIGLAGLAVAIVVGSLLSWTLVHRPYTHHSASAAATTVAWSPHGKYLAFITSTYTGQGQSTNTAQLWVWDATSGKTLLLYTLTSPNASVGITWSPNDKYLAFTPSTSTSPASEQVIYTAQLWVWDATSGKSLPIYAGSNSTVGIPSSRGGIVWSPTDGKHLTFFANSTYPSCQAISSSCNETVRIWDDTSKGSIYVLPLGPSDVITMDLSPDGTRIATGSADGTVYVLYVV
jgi:hypothetical protein